MSDLILGCLAGVKKTFLLAVNLALLGSHFSAYYLQASV